MGSSLEPLGKILILIITILMYFQKVFTGFLVELPVNILREGDYIISVDSVIPNIMGLDKPTKDLQFTLVDTMAY